MRPPENPPEKRITLLSIAGFILEQFNLERGLGYTIKGLLADPHGTLYEYLFLDRRRMMKPLPFLLLMVGLVVFFSFRFLGLEEEFNREFQNPELAELPLWMQPVIEQMSLFLKKYFNLALMSALPATALATFLVFRRQGLHYAEHLVINTYIYCIQTVLTLPLFPLIAMAPMLGSPLAIITLAYQFYAYRYIFELSWAGALVKTFLIYFISQMLYGVILFLVFVVITYLF